MAVSRSMTTVPEPRSADLDPVDLEQVEDAVVGAGDRAGVVRSGAHEGRGEPERDHLVDLGQLRDVVAHRGGQAHQAEVVGGDDEIAPEPRRQRLVDRRPDRRVEDQEERDQADADHEGEGGRGRPAGLRTALSRASSPAAHQPGDRRRARSPRPRPGPGSPAGSRRTPNTPRPTCSGSKRRPRRRPGQRTASITRPRTRRTSDRLLVSTATSRRAASGGTREARHAGISADTSVTTMPVARAASTAVGVMASDESGSWRNPDRASATPGRGGSRTPTRPRPRPPRRSARPGGPGAGLGGAHRHSSAIAGALGHDDRARCR